MFFADDSGIDLDFVWFDSPFRESHFCEFRFGVCLQMISFHLLCLRSRWVFTQRAPETPETSFFLFTIHRFISFPLALPHRGFRRLSIASEAYFPSLSLSLSSRPLFLCSSYQRFLSFFLSFFLSQALFRLSSLKFFFLYIYIFLSESLLSEALRIFLPPAGSEA